MIKRKALISLGIAINLFIWINSILPGNDSANLSGGITEFIYHILNKLNIGISIDLLSLMIRKLAHFTEFFILGITWVFIFKKYNYRYPITFIYGLLVALIDEFIQYFIPGRASSIFDVAIDGAGVLFGLLIIYLLEVFILRKNEIYIDKEKADE
ncbi:VanZ family protein [Acholeplasma hippikon]|uniref:Predicted integral membrane protein n=1 Tax=Acholeplasma hippikon TaxID=264636 RepID=A0A449BL59_9MOLU|nr:VanZ family protein [Acholeplasma hippikon]VEU83162.1 Predicted integral membrane protein [Acholeplasma hippikon]